MYSDNFHHLIRIKYRLYNGLFLTLPFSPLQEWGAMLPVFAETCRKGLAEGRSPFDIVEHYLEQVDSSSFRQKSDLLFLYLQIIERQIVLFDALEDAAFAETHAMQGPGTLKHFLAKVSEARQEKKLTEALKHYCTRIVLTAHPTQFYPNSVLSIIQELAQAVHDNNLEQIQQLLLQMGKTPFRNTRQPTPYEEAASLMQYLKECFLPAFASLQKDLHAFLPRGHSAFSLGFWPGGDRDGNPNVTVETTLDVAQMLRQTIIQEYLKELQLLKRRLTFRGMEARLAKIEEGLRSSYKEAQEFLHDLDDLRRVVHKQHQGLFCEKIDSLRHKVQLFRFHFASIDLRQDSRVHSSALEELLPEYKRLPLSERLSFLEAFFLSKRFKKPTQKNLSPLTLDILGSLTAARTIQRQNGEEGLHRYVISNTQSAANALEVLALARYADWSLEELSLDVVPLFETIEDLRNAPSIMRALFESPLYRSHLKRRRDVQTVMLGFSDGTKDGGYITANWSIFQCKQELNALSMEYGIHILFFDGRGGPPARGGGNTHKFYHAMGHSFLQNQVQLTIQGQTISSNFGTPTSARYNVEQLFTAGLEHHVFEEKETFPSEEQRHLLQALSDVSLKAYLTLKEDPLFLPYLEEMTPLHFYGDLNIASRPPKRKRKGPLLFEDLRAIPFVSSWSQIKQNVPGFYGIGTALNSLVKQGKLPQLRRLFRDSPFFRTLLENAMQSLCKSSLPLTQHMRHDSTYGRFWQRIADEATLSETMLKEVSQQAVLLENDPIIQQSIQMREELILPLLVIQQYAMIQLRNKKGNTTPYRKIVLKSLAASINASRNSA